MLKGLMLVLWFGICATFFGAGAYLIHPGLCLMVISAILFLVGGIILSELM